MQNHRCALCTGRLLEVQRVSSVRTGSPGRREEEPVTTRRAGRACFGRGASISAAPGQELFCLPSGDVLRLLHLQVPARQCKQRVRCADGCKMHNYGPRQGVWAAWHTRRLRTSESPLRRGRKSYLHMTRGITRLVDYSCSRLRHLAR